MLSLMTSGVHDNSHKFTADIIDTGGKLPTSLFETGSKYTGSVTLIWVPIHKGIPFLTGA